MKPVQGRMVGAGRGVWTYKSLREVPEGTRAHIYYMPIIGFSTALYNGTLGLRILIHHGSLWNISERKEQQDSVDAKVRKLFKVPVLISCGSKISS